SAGLVKSAHDCSEGGFLVALSECCISHHIARETPKLLGARIDLTMASGSRTDALLFGEAQSRVIISVAPDQVANATREAEEQGIKVLRVGTVGGDALAIKTSLGEQRWAIAELHDLWWNAI